MGHSHLMDSGCSLLTGYLDAWAIQPKVDPKLSQFVNFLERSHGNKRNKGSEKISFRVSRRSAGNGTVVASICLATLSRFQ